jgi:hypothetical protein
MADIFDNASAYVLDAVKEFYQDIVKDWFDYYLTESLKDNPYNLVVEFVNPMHTLRLYVDANKQSYLDRNDNEDQIIGEIPDSTLQLCIQQLVEQLNNKEGYTITEETSDNGDEVLKISLSGSLTFS